MKRGLRKNGLYLLKLICKTDKVLLFFMILYVPVCVLLPFVQAYLPRVIVNTLETKSTIAIFLRNFAFVAAAASILTVLQRGIAERLNFRGGHQRSALMTKVVQTQMKKSYEIISSPQGVQAFDHAASAVYGDGEITQQFAKKLSELCVSIAGILFFGVYIVLINPILLGVIMASALVSYGYGKYEVRKKDEIQKKQKKEFTKMDYLTHNACTPKSAKDIKLYKMENKIVAAFQTVLQSITKYNATTRRVNFGGAILSGLFIFLRDGLAYFYLTVAVFAKQISIGDFIFLFAIIKSFSDWLLGIVSQIIDLQKESLNIDYYRDYCEEEDGLNRGAGLALPEHYNITFKNVSFKYPESEKYILKNINLHINDKEKIAVVGINGAGKTTLTALMMNLLQPTEGEVLLNDKNVNEYNIEAYYSLFSTVFQDIFIVPATIKEIITAMPAEDAAAVHEEKFRSAIQKAGMEKVIAELPNKENTYLVKGVYPDAVDLSGGQQQRLLLARALYKDAPITILDEPTAALDPIAESEIYSEYSEMTKDKTAVFISHRLASTRFCDRILLLEDGEIIEEGTHDELLALNGKYKEMFSAQSSYYQDEKIEDTKNGEKQNA